MDIATMSVLRNRIKNIASADVNEAIKALVDGSPDALDTLKELASAINNDAEFYKTIMAAIDSVNEELSKKISDAQGGGTSVIITKTRENIVPVLSANGQSGYNITVSSAWSSSYDGWMAFNANESNGWCSGQNAVTDQFLQIELPSPEIIVELYLKNRAADTKCPTDFKFYGSVDGAVYDLLHSETNLTWDYLQERTFRVQCTKAYKFYKIVGNTTSPYNNVSIGKMQLYKFVDLEGYVKDTDFDSAVADINARIDSLSTKDGSSTQYGGFDTKVLFNGQATSMGSYLLSDNLKNYGFLVVTCVTNLDGYPGSYKNDMVISPSNLANVKFEHLYDASLGGTQRSICYHFASDGITLIIDDLVATNAISVGIVRVVGVKGQIPGIVSGGKF